VFVSSHLMSELQNTAEHLIVIGGGELIADESVTEFAARGTRQSVTVRTPDTTAPAAVGECDGSAPRSNFRPGRATRRRLRGLRVGRRTGAGHHGRHGGEGEV
jgi:ABC-2 type transport system ATP-binding protein